MKHSHLIFVSLVAFMFAAFAHSARASVEVRVGSFEKPTSAQSQQIKGIGFQPKAVIFYYASTTDKNAVLGAADDANNAGAFGMGFAASAAGNAEGAVTFWNRGFTTSDTGSGHNAGDVIILTGITGTGAGGGTTYGQAQLTSFDTNGFTLNWSTANTSKNIVNYIALGGDDITNASSSAFTLSTAAGDQSVSGMGFKPDFVMLLPAPDNRAAGTFTTANAFFGIGFGANSSTNGATSTIEQGVSAVCDQDNENASDTNRYQTMGSTTIGMVINSGAGSQCSDIDSTASLASFDSDGFTINKKDAPASAYSVYYLAIKGGNWKVGSFNKATAAGSQAVAGLPFMPKGAFFQSVGDATTALPTADNSTQDMQISIGATGTTTAQLESENATTTQTQAIWTFDSSGDGTPDPDVISTSTQAIVLGGNGTLASLGRVSSYDPNGFTLNWNKSDSTAREVLYWTVGEVASTTQRAYVFTNDDGGNIASSTMRRDTATSTAITGVRQGERLVARVQIDETSDMATSTNAYRLQWENNTDAAGAWNDLGSTTQISWSLSQYGAPRVRERLVPLPRLFQSYSCAAGTGYATGTSQFIAGSGTSTPISLRMQCAELAYAIETSNALRGKTYRLRLIDGVRNEDLSVKDGTYAAYPTLTIARDGFATASTTYWKGVFGATTTVAVDGAWGTALNPSLAIGSDGNPLIASRSFGGNDDIYLARCLNASCTATTSITLDGAWGDAFIPSLAIGSDGNPLVASHQSGGNADIYLARCLNSTCTATTSITLDGAWGTAFNSSLAIGSDGNPLVASRSADGNADIYLAYCLNSTCTATTSVALDGAWGAPLNSSLAIGSDGNPLVASNGGGNDIYLARCLNSTCTATTSVALDGAWGDAFSPSLAIGSDGNPLAASYQSGGNADIYLARCLNSTCTATTSIALDGAWGSALDPSLAIGSDGNPLVASSLGGGNADIYLARCLNASCTATTSVALDGAWGSATSPSLAIGSDGNPLVASRSSDGNADIYLAICHSLDCTTSYPAMSTSTAQATTSPYWFFDHAEYDNASTSNDVHATTTGLNARLVQQFSHASTTNTDSIGIVWEGNVSGGGYGTTTTLEIYNFSGGYWEIIATGTALNGLDYTLQATTTGTASNYYNGGNRVVARIVTATTSATTTQSLATDFINISFGVAGASLRQHYYRWRNDDGNETGASWAQTEDTALASGVYIGDRRRLRVSVSNASAAASNITYRLEYASGASCDSGWTPVPSAATTEHWVMDPSYYLSEEAVTTAALSVPPGKSFAAGYTKQSSNQTSAHNLTASQYSEFEYAIKSTANAATGTNYCFRLTNAGTALTTYSVTPQITLSAAARPQTGGGGGEGVGGGSQQSGGTGQGGGAGSEGSGAGGQTGGGSGQGGGSGSQEFVPWLMPWLGYMYNLLNLL